MRLGWIYHEDFLKHDTGEDHPEQPARLTVIIEALEQAGLLAKMIPLPFRAPHPIVLTWLHDATHVALIRLACKKGMAFVGSVETPVCPCSYDVALLAVGGVMAACDAVMNGQVDRAFCAVRPPGHHAEPDQAMGFCLFNNVAIAAEHLIRRYSLQRVAIVDFDVHHGNGTQKIFEERSDVLFISIHEDPLHLFPGTGRAEEQGIGPGKGYTLNVPMLPGSGDAEYHEAFNRLIIPRLDEFAPQFLLLSAGFDALLYDRMAHINLTPESYTWITRQLVDVANRHCRGRVVSVLEGGYEPYVLGPSVANHVAVLLEEIPAEAERAVHADNYVI